MDRIDWGKTLTSKTVLLGTLMIAAGIAEYIAGLPPAAPLAQIVSGVLAVVVRFVTNDSLLKPPTGGAPA